MKFDAKTVNKINDSSNVWCCKCDLIPLVNWKLTITCQESFVLFDKICKILLLLFFFVAVYLSVMSFLIL